MKKVLLTITLCISSLVIIAQEAKLETKLKANVLPQKPKVKVIRDTKKVSAHPHHRNEELTWVFNSKIKIKAYRPILNMENIEKFTIDKPTRSLLFEYKIDSPEIIDLYELARKYCHINHKNILFSIDDEWQEQPDSAFIAIDAIKHVRVVDSKNYPSITEKKASFIVINIKTVNPPKKEEEDDGKPKIYIR